MALETNNRLTLEHLAQTLTANKAMFATKARVSLIEEAVDSIEIPTDVSQLENDAGYQTGSQVESSIKGYLTGVYKPSGTVKFNELPEPTADVLGNVYDVSNSFTTDAKFKNPGEHFPAGTNVVVVETEAGGYVYDVLSGFVDLSHLVEKEPGKVLSSNDFTNELKEKLESDNVASSSAVQALINEIYGVVTE